MAILNLRLSGRDLLWTSDGSTWGKVDPKGEWPITGCNPDRDIQWLADKRTIEKIEIIPDTAGDVIFEERDVVGNDTRWPEITVPADITHRKTQKYTIKVYPSGGGDPLNFDPKIQVPQQ